MFGDRGERTALSYLVWQHNSRLQHLRGSVGLPPFKSGLLIKLTLSG
jgi:hypothetical protein